MAKRKPKDMTVTESLAKSDRLTPDDHRDLRIAVLEARNAALEAERAGVMAQARERALNAKVGELAAKYSATSFEVDTNGQPTGRIARESSSTEGKA